MIMAGSKDRIIKAIGITQELLSKLEHGLLAEKPLEEIERLAKDASLAALSIEVMVTNQLEKSRSKHS